MRLVNRKVMTVDQVASALGISKQTLLRYEKRGIVPKPFRNPINKWREYSQDDLKKCKRILGRKS